MSQLRKYEIKPENGAIAIRIINVTTPNAWEYYRFTAIKSILPVSVLGMGARQSTNLRLNPLRHDDKLEFVISFHDENESAPLRYHIEDVNNQGTWTNNMAGLIIALADMNSWMGVAGTSSAAIAAALTDVTRVDTTLRSAIVGSIPIGAYSYSIFNAGAANGLVNGVVIKPGETFTKDAGGSGNKFVAAVSYDGTGTDLVIGYVS